MTARHFSMRERGFMLGVPAAWAALLLFHPMGDQREFFPTVTGDVGAWLAVHVGTMLLIPALGFVVLMLLRNLESRAARVARIGVGVYVLFYTTWEVLVGIGTGILVNEVNSLTGEAAVAGQALVETYNSSDLLIVFLIAGGLGLIVGLVGAGKALVDEAGAPRAVFALLAIAAFPIGFHEPPLGPIGLALFAGAVHLVTRSTPETKAVPASAGQKNPQRT